MQRNLTLVVDEETLLAARKLALERRTSVNELVRRFLRDLVSGDAHKHAALASLRQGMRAGLFDVGERAWTRDELHER